MILRCLRECRDAEDTPAALVMFPFPARAAVRGRWDEFLPVWLTPGFLKEGLLHHLILSSPQQKDRDQSSCPLLGPSIQPKILPCLSKTLKCSMGRNYYPNHHVPYMAVAFLVSVSHLLTHRENWSNYGDVNQLNNMMCFASLIAKRKEVTQVHLAAGCFLKTVIGGY